MGSEEIKGLLKAILVYFCIPNFKCVFCNQSQIIFFFKSFIQNFVNPFYSLCSIFFFRLNKFLKKHSITFFE